MASIPPFPGEQKSRAEITEDCWRNEQDAYIVEGNYPILRIPILYFAIAILGLMVTLPAGVASARARMGELFVLDGFYILALGFLALLVYSMWCMIAWTKYHIARRTYLRRLAQARDGDRSEARKRVRMPPAP